MSDLIEKELSSTINLVTVFSQGAQIERGVALALGQGDYTIVVRDLPQDADPHSIRVEGLCDGQMDIGIVDSMVEAVRRDDDQLSKSERRLLEQQIESLEDNQRQVQARIQTLEIQKNLVQNLAQLPLQPIAGKGEGASGQDWNQIYDLIGERLSTANDIVFKAQLEEREILEKIHDLKQQLNQKPPKQKFIRAVSIRLYVKEAVKGQLMIRYHVHNASWKPVYDMRLDTSTKTGVKTEGNAKAQLSIERRAEIRQSSSESWDDIALKLSTTSPTSQTAAPQLSAHQLDVVYQDRMEAVGRARVKAPRNAKMVAASAELMQQDAPVMARFAKEREIEVEQAAYQTVFSVPDKTSVGHNNEIVRVYLLSETITPELFIQSVPKLDLQAFLYTRFKWEGAVALLAGKTWLYRDGVFLGTGKLPLTQQGEKQQIGFGVDDKVKVSRREMNRITGNRGLIKNHKIEERDFVISIENMHEYEVKTRIVDQIPFADDESITVEFLQGSTLPTSENVNDLRGILLWKQTLQGNEKKEIRLHYKVSWPKDTDIML